MNAAARMLESRSVHRLLLLAGVIGPALFIGVFLVEGATRPGYSAWRNFVSSLSLSDQGWEQIANFIVCGLLVFAFACALPRALGPGRGVMAGAVLLGAFGLGLLVAGIFVTDGSLGYPPGAPGRQTLHGTIHGVAGLVDFTTVALTALTLARRFAGDLAWKGWALYSTLTGAAVLLLFVAFTATSVFDERGILPNSPTGLLQRVAIVIGWGWIALLALRLLRSAPDSVVAASSSEARRSGWASE